MGGAIKSKQQITFKLKHGNMWWHTKRFVSKIKKSEMKKKKLKWNCSATAGFLYEKYVLYAEKISTWRAINQIHHTAKTQSIHNNDNEASNLAMSCTLTIEMVEFSFYILSSCRAPNNIRLKAPNQVFQTCCRIIWIWHLTKKHCLQDFKQGNAYLDICNVQLAFLFLLLILLSLCAGKLEAVDKERRNH